MKNQMEKKMENEMEAGITYFCSGGSVHLARLGRIVGLVALLAGFWCCAFNV